MNVSQSLHEIQGINDAKDRLYSHGKLPYSGYRAAAALGVAPWRSALARAWEKGSRIESMVALGEDWTETALEMAHILLVAIQLRGEEA